MKTLRACFKALIFIVVCFALSIIFSSTTNVDKNISVSEGDQSSNVAEGILTSDDTGVFPLVTNVCVGDIVMFDDLEFSVNSFSFSDYIIDVMGGKEAGENNKYCNIEVWIYNPTPESRSFRNDNLFFENTLYNYVLVFDEEYKYYSSWIQGYTNFLENYESIRPLETISAYICFEIPEQILTSPECLYLSLSHNSVDDDAEIRWILRESTQSK